MKKQITGNLAKAERHVIVIEPTEKQQAVKLRVAAYTRVSTDSEDQLNSFAAQNRYYTALISAKENWIMADIYADCGTSGTSIEKRDEFQRMLSDCRKGLIDRILCKSISRFARNSKECLEIIRELKTLGIGICFEKEHIDTAKMSGEMLTAIFASMAQAESESISKNRRLGIQMRMKSGQFNTCFAPFGYRIVDKQLQIEPSEAEVVRKIYQDYLSGESPRAIAVSLNTLGVCNKTWSRELVEYILKNERYCGNAILQKRYTTDSFPTTQKRNKGEREMYFVANSNDPIISQEEFDRAQELRQSRLIPRPPVPQLFSEKLKCGCCGSTFRVKQQGGKKYWSCRTHEEAADKCPVTQIDELQIISAFLRLYYKLKQHGAEILARMVADLQQIRRHRMLWSPDVIELNKRISNITSQNQLLAMLKQQGGVDPGIFISRSNELAEQLRIAKKEKERLLNAESDKTTIQTQELMEILEAGPDILDEFDGELFGELVEKVIIESNERLRFQLKNGLELAESIERTVR